MKVYLRHEEELKGNYFCECDPLKMEEIVSALQCAGVYCYETGDVINTVGYQFIHEEERSGAEIILFEEEELPGGTTLSHDISASSTEATTEAAQHGYGKSPVCYVGFRGSSSDTHEVIKAVQETHMP